MMCTALLPPTILCCLWNNGKKATCKSLPLFSTDVFFFPVYFQFSPDVEPSAMEGYVLGHTEVRYLQNSLEFAFRIYSNCPSSR